MKVVSKEPYWGETIPLRWLQFEEEKEASTRQMLKMNEVRQTFFCQNYFDPSTEISLKFLHLCKLPVHTNNL